MNKIEEIKQNLKNLRLRCIQNKMINNERNFVSTKLELIDRLLNLRTSPGKIMAVIEALDDYYYGTPRLNQTCSDSTPHTGTADNDDGSGSATI